MLNFPHARRHFRESRFAKGELLFARGDPGGHLYLIADGRVRVAVVTDEGGELSFRHAAAGDLLGEIAALDREPISSDIVALRPETACSFEREAFEQLYATHGAAATSLIAFLCRRIRDTRGQLEAIALCPVETRLARFLLLAIGNGQVLAIGNGQAAAGKRIPLSELAQLLGANRPNVNAALGLLERAGAIGRTIYDTVKLTQIAQGEEA